MVQQGFTAFCVSAIISIGRFCTQGCTTFESFLKGMDALFFSGFFMNSLSVTQLAEYLQVTKRSVQRRAKREQWPFKACTGLGGTRRMYTFVSLPNDVKQRVISRMIAKHEQQGFEYNPNTSNKKHTLLDSPFIVATKIDASEWYSQHIFACGGGDALDTAELNKAYLKVGLLVLAQLYVSRFAVGKIKGFDAFCQLYNSRQLTLHKAIYTKVNHFSRITLLRWEKQLKESDTERQLSGNANFKNALDSDLHNIAQELLMTSPQLSANRLRQYFLTIFPDRKISSNQSLSLWLKQQKTQE